MANQITPFLMTLIDVQDHSPVASLFSEIFLTVVQQSARF